MCVDPAGSKSPIVSKKTFKSWKRESGLGIGLPLLKLIANKQFSGLPGISETGLLRTRIQTHSIGQFYLALYTYASICYHLTRWVGLMDTPANTLERKDLKTMPSIVTFVLLASALLAGVSGSQPQVQSQPAGMASSLDANPLPMPGVPTPQRPCCSVDGQ